VPAELAPAATAGPAERGSRANRTAGIVGLGQALPDRRVTNDEIARRVGKSADWIFRRTGIRERRRAAGGERVSDLAARAGSRALRHAQIPAAELDLVLVATLASDEITPGTAPIVAHELGASNAAAIDVGAACAGSLAALAQGTAWIEAGRADNALIIGAEVLTRFLDGEDPRTAPLFGDGAGAMVLASDAPGEVGRFVFGSNGGLAHTIRASRSDAVIAMDGHDTFLNAVERLCACTRELLTLEGLGLEDVDLFVYHQANARILASVRERLDLTPERVFDCIAHHGNTSAASIPLALGEATRLGVVRRGDKVLLGAVGAGLVWGATMLTWGCTS
jgi:3-oxoacyl-[acyl-carrier-protein] synthase-3